MIYKNRHFKIVVTVFFVLFIVSCSKQGVRSDNSKQNKKSDSTQTNKLTENQKKVLAGAKKCLEAKFSYDMTMGYYVLTYKDGSNTGNKVFPGGDMAPEMGVCTEVTVRALRWGGICDLQEEIYNDLKAHFSEYPMSRWGAKKPDPNIDQRRVPNQMVWFEKHWNVISGDNYQPGDVVAWDMNGDSWGDHIGIVSDALTSEGIPKLIHNFPDPGYVAEEDVLGRWEIIGHYRIK